MYLHIKKEKNKEKMEGVHERSFQVNGTSLTQHDEG